MNFDTLTSIGDPEEVEVMGAERTTFYPTVEEAAKTLGLTIRSEPRPEAGFCYRSDRFNFARVGIPSFSISEGLKFKGQPINSSLGWILRATRSWLRSLMNSGHRRPRKSNWSVGCRAMSLM